MSVQDTYRGAKLPLLSPMSLWKGHECPRGKLGHLQKDLVAPLWHAVPRVPVANGQQTFGFTLRYDRKHLQLFCHRNKIISWLIWASYGINYIFPWTKSNIDGNRYNRSQLIYWYWKSMVDRIITKTCVIDCSSISNINRLIDIDWYRLSSIIDFIDLTRREMYNVGTERLFLLIKAIVLFFEKLVNHSPAARALQAILVFSQHLAWVYYARKPRENAVYCLRNSLSSVWFIFANKTSNKEKTKGAH